MLAFREILMNAFEHGADFHPSKLVEVAAVHTQRATVFYVHDPGSGFRWDEFPMMQCRIHRTHPLRISNCARAWVCGRGVRYSGRKRHRRRVDL